MRLITAHRILIGAAILFFVFYAVAAFVHGRPGAPVHAVVAIAIAIGLVVYYRTLGTWGAPKGPPTPPSARTSPAEPAPYSTRAVLIYDGDCSMCRASAMWIMRRALSRGALEILPCRSEARRARYPDIAEPACLTAMHLVLPDGRIAVGGDAVPEILRRVHGWGWLATVFAVPGMRPIARRVYAWVARNRMKISCARPRS